VHWVDQGIGCSKVPDINNIELMEDRATLRISSQMLSNWLLHGVCNEAQVISIMKRMACIVDKQNSDTSGYRNISTDIENNIAFQAAKELILKGKDQPNGYSEPLLHAYRLKAKHINQPAIPKSMFNPRRLHRGRYVTI